MQLVCVSQSVCTNLQQPYTVAAFGICLWQLLKNGKGLTEFLANFADEDAFRKEVGGNGRRPPVDPAWTQPMQTILRACWAVSPSAC